MVMVDGSEGVFTTLSGVLETELIGADIVVSLGDVEVGGTERKLGLGDILRSAMAGADTDTEFGFGDLLKIELCSGDEGSRLPLPEPTLPLPRPPCLFPGLLQSSCRPGILPW